MTDPAAAGDAASRIRFIEYKGKQILLQDASNLPSAADGLPLVALSKSIAAKQPPASLLILTIVTNSRFDRKLIEALKELTVHNKQYARASALVGLSGLQRSVYAAVSQLTGRRLPTFNTEDEAKEWLISQA
jgi:hypothetical protein